MGVGACSAYMTTSFRSSTRASPERFYLWASQSQIKHPYPTSGSVGCNLALRGHGGCSPQSSHADAALLCPPRLAEGGLHRQARGPVRDARRLLPLPRRRRARRRAQRSRPRRMVPGGPRRVAQSARASPTPTGCALLSGQPRDSRSTDPAASAAAIRAPSTPIFSARPGRSMTRATWVKRCAGSTSPTRFTWRGRSGRTP